MSEVRCPNCDAELELHFKAEYDIPAVDDREKHAVTVYQKEERVIEALAKQTGLARTSDLVVAMGYPTWTLKEVLMGLVYKGIVHHSHTSLKADLWRLTTDNERKAGTGYPQVPTETVSA